MTDYGIIWYIFGVVSGVGWGVIICKINSIMKAHEDIMHWNAEER